MTEITFRHLTINDGPLRNIAVFQPAGPIRVYHLSLEDVKGAIGHLPHSVHHQTDMASYPKSEFLIVSERYRPEVESLLGEKLTLLGRYEPTDDGDRAEAAWQPALSHEELGTLNFQVTEAMANGDSQRVEQLVSHVSPRISPEYYGNFLVPVMRAVFANGDLHTAKLIATVVSWVEPDMPIVGEVLDA